MTFRDDMFAVQLGILTWCMCGFYQRYMLYLQLRIRMRQNCNVIVACKDMKNAGARLPGSDIFDTVARGVVASANQQQANAGQTTVTLPV